MKICPFCAEEIQEAAIRCRYCGSDLAEGTGAPRHPATSPWGADSGPETTYYSDSSITITSTRALIAGKTYAMANITSVSSATINTGLGCGCALACVGAVAAVGLFTSSTVFLGIIGLVMLLCGFAMMAQTSYVVRIGSASGEANALQHTDRKYIQTIVDAMNQAIIDRR